MADEKQAPPPSPSDDPAAAPAPKPAGPAAAAPAKAAAPAAAPGHGPAPPSGPTDPPPPAGTQVPAFIEALQAAFPGAIEQRQLLGRRLDGDRLGGSTHRHRGPPARHARGEVRLPVGRDGVGLAAAGEAVRRRVLPVFDDAPPARPREGTGRRRRSRPVGHGGLAGGELAGARGLGSVRRELHGSSRSPAHPDARRVAGTSAAEGLSARGSGRAAHGESRSTGSGCGCSTTRRTSSRSDGLRHSALCR